MPFETFFRWVEGQGHKGHIKSKWSYIGLVPAIICIFMHGFQKNFAVVVLEEVKCYLKHFFR